MNVTMEVPAHNQNFEFIVPCRAYIFCNKDNALARAFFCWIEVLTDHFRLFLDWFWRHYWVRRGCLD
jgi:hypothetical protein